MRNILSEVLVCEMCWVPSQIMHGLILCPFCLTHVIKTPSTIDMTCIYIAEFGFIIGPFKSKCSAYWCLLAPWIITFLTKLSICVLPYQGRGSVVVFGSLQLYVRSCIWIRSYFIVIKCLSNQQGLEPNPWKNLSTVQEKNPPQQPIIRAHSLSIYLTLSKRLFPWFISLFSPPKGFVVTSAKWSKIPFWWAEIEVV